MGVEAAFRVLVDLEASALCLRCRIEDRGTPLPGDTLPGGSLPATDPVAHEKWPEGGVRLGPAAPPDRRSDLPPAWRLEPALLHDLLTDGDRPTAQPQRWRPWGTDPSANFCRQNKEMPYCGTNLRRESLRLSVGVAAEASLGVACIKAPTQCATSRSLPQPLPNTTVKHALAVGVRTRSLRVGYPSGGTECAISIIRAGPRSTRRTACARRRTLLAAKVAVDILQAGGNAVDAAIAGKRVLLGLCEPAMTGIGGDCFALIKPAGSEEIIALNGSGRAPFAALSAAGMRAAGHSHMPLFGAPEPVTVPGCGGRVLPPVGGSRGKLGLTRCSRLSSTMPRPAFRSRRAPPFDWKNHHGNLGGRARDYYLIDGEPPCPGQLFRQPRQAEVLRKIAAEGRAGFYEGEVAEDMVASLQAISVACTRRMISAGNRLGLHPRPVSGFLQGASNWWSIRPNGQGATAIPAEPHPGGSSTSPRWTPGPRSAPISRPRRPSSALCHAGPDQWAMPTTSRACRRCLDPATGKALAARIDPTRAHALPAASHRKPAQGNRVSDGGGSRPHGGVDHLFDLQGFRLGRGVGQVRHPVPQSRRGVPPRRGAPERGGRRQAADAHDHPRDAAPERQGRHALRRHGRAVPVHRPRADGHQYSSISGSTRRRRSTRRAASPNTGR